MKSQCPGALCSGAATGRFPVGISPWAVRDQPEERMDAPSTQRHLVAAPQLQQGALCAHRAAPAPLQGRDGLWKLLQTRLERFADFPIPWTISLAPRSSGNTNSCPFTCAKKVLSLFPESNYKNENIRLTKVPAEKSVTGSTLNSAHQTVPRTLVSALSF